MFRQTITIKYDKDLINSLLKKSKVKNIDELVNQSIKELIKNC